MSYTNGIGNLQQVHRLDYSGNDPAGIAGGGAGERAEAARCIGRCMREPVATRPI